MVDMEFDLDDHLVGRPLDVRNCLTMEAIFTDRKYGVPAIKLLNAVTTAPSLYFGEINNLCGRYFAVTYNFVTGDK